MFPPSSGATLHRPDACARTNLGVDWRVPGVLAGSMPVSSLQEAGMFLPSDRSRAPERNYAPAPRGLSSGTTQHIVASVLGHSQDVAKMAESAGVDTDRRISDGWTPCERPEHAGSAEPQSPAKGTLAGEDTRQVGRDPKTASPVLRQRFRWDVLPSRDCGGRRTVVAICRSKRGATAPGGRTPSGADVRGKRSLTAHCGRCTGYHVCSGGMTTCWTVRRRSRPPCRRASARTRSCDP